MTTSVYIKGKKCKNDHGTGDLKKVYFAVSYYPLSWSNMFLSGRDKRGSVITNIRDHGKEMPL
jgi:hypothetical protein